jgi:hypothetical protein
MMWTCYIFPPSFFLFLFPRALGQFLYVNNHADYFLMERIMLINFFSVSHDVLDQLNLELIDVGLFPYAIAHRSARMCVCNCATLPDFFHMQLHVCVQLCICLWNASAIFGYRDC